MSPVFLLRAVILALNDDSRGNVGYPYRGIRFVDVLTPRTGRPEGVYFEFPLVYFHVNFVGLR